MNEKRKEFRQLFASGVFNIYELSQRLCVNFNLVFVWRFEDFPEPRTGKRDHYMIEGKPLTATQLKRYEQRRKPRATKRRQRKLFQKLVIEQQMTMEEIAKTVGIGRTTAFVWKRDLIKFLKQNT